MEHVVYITSVTVYVCSDCLAVLYNLLICAGFLLVARLEVVVTSQLVGWDSKDGTVIDNRNIFQIFKMNRNFLVTGGAQGIGFAYCR